MDFGREAMTARVVTLMTPREKSDLQARARRAGVSVGAFVRRAVEAYDPEELRQLEELAEMARAFRESAERASRAVDRANANIGGTFAQLSSRRRA